MKIKPEELRKLADDLRWVIAKNSDVMQSEPDIAKDIVNARDKAQKKYQEVSQ